MTSKSLIDFYKHNQGKVSDKWTSYLGKYESLFSPLRDKAISLFEIGIQNGGSLEIWSKYFLKAKVFVGCDIDKKCSNLVYKDSRINLVIGDANQKKIQEDIFKKSRSFDIVIDDGSHRSSDIIKSFVNYFPHVADNGLYIVEDMHCSYWKDFEGGLFAPYSSMMFFKYLTDLVNYEHWGVSKSYTDILEGFNHQYDLKLKQDTLKNIASIEFLNSMCIIRKSSGKTPELGLRLVTGKDAAISDNRKLNSTEFIPPSQINNVFSQRKLPPTKEVIDLYKETEQQAKTIDTLNEKISKQKIEITNFINSNSFKLTAPLRRFRQILDFPKISLMSVFLKVHPRVKNSKIKLFIKKIFPRTFERLKNAYHDSLHNNLEKNKDDKILTNNFNVSIRLIDLIKFFPNSKKTILSFVPYNFSSGKFGGAHKVRSVYETLSKKFNVNIISPVGYDNKLELEELYKNVNLYKVPISLSYFNDDYLSYIKIFKEDIFNDILMGSKIHKLKDITNLIKILSMHTDYIYCEHAQSYPFVKEYKNIIPIIINHHNFEYELKQNYFKKFANNKEAKFLLKILQNNESHSVNDCDFNTFVSSQDLINFNNAYGYNSQNYKIIKNFNNI